MLKVIDINNTEDFKYRDKSLCENDNFIPIKFKNLLANHKLFN